jgi:hypothetical protein
MKEKKYPIYHVSADLVLVLFGRGKGFSGNSEVLVNIWSEL